MKWLTVPELALATAFATLACGSSSGEPDPTPCTDGQVECSADALTLRVCESGKWTTTECLSSEGKLCEEGSCVDPWRYGAPTFDQCASEPLATPESLNDKATYFDEIARRLHIHPDLGWASDVFLKSGVDQSGATWNDVEAWRSGENDGLWNALYIASQAYRWAVTKDPEALDNLQLLLNSEQKRMSITGVPGLFTRQMIPPGIPGIACPTDPAEYVPSDDKTNNQWVSVGDDGCLRTTDPTTLAWKSSSVCGLSEFAGWCWLDNVSEDEYAGHMLALGAVDQLVDDFLIQAKVDALLGQVGDHLVENQLTFVDWDGRVTEHGRIYAGTLLGGYNSAMALAFMKTIVVATGDPKFAEFYDDCLLKKSGENDCIHHPGAKTTAYDEELTPTGLNLGCKSNWNNYSMYMLSQQGLLSHEYDPVVREKFQTVLRDEMWQPAGEVRPLSEQNNALFDFIYAVGKAQGPASDGPAVAAVENGICMLRQLPAQKIRVNLECPPGKCVQVCEDRQGQPMTDYPRPIVERCVTGFVWWGSPYGTGGCVEDTRVVYSPTDYLLAYWMGRYYGFIDPTS